MAGMAGSLERVYSNHRCGERARQGDQRSAALLRVVYQMHSRNTVLVSRLAISFKMVNAPGSKVDAQAAKAKSDLFVASV